MAGISSGGLRNEPSKRWNAVGRWAAAAAFAAILVAGTSAAVVGLHARTTFDTQIGPREPLAVDARELIVVDHYQIQESYAGRIETARETQVGFEREGLVTAIFIEEGTNVDQGQILAKLDIAYLEIERDRLLADRAAVDAEIELARLTAERREKLNGRGWETSQKYDEARFGLAASQAKRQAITAALAAIALEIEKSTIYAPFAGTIASRTVDEGTVVTAGMPLLRLQETGRPQVRIGVPPDRALMLSAGQPVDLTYQRDGIKGHVVAVAPDLQTETRTVSVLIDLDPAATVTAGQIARLILNRRVDTHGAWVPLGALQEGERGLWSVQTASPEDSGYMTKLEAVEILHIDGEQAFVRGSFPPNAILIESGPHRLAVGQPVHPQMAIEG